MEFHIINHLKQSLLFLPKFGGFPLEPSPEDSCNLIFPKKEYFKIAFYIIGQMAPMTMAVVAYYFQTGGLENLDSSTGMTYLEKVSMMIFGGQLMIIYEITMGLYWFRKKDFGDFIMEVQQCVATLDQDVFQRQVEEAKKNMKLKIVLVMIISFGSALSGAYSGSQMLLEMLPEYPGDFIYYTFILTNPIINNLFILVGIICPSLACDYMIQILISLYGCCETELRQAYTNEKLISNALKKTLSICQLNESLNKLLSPFLALIFYICLILASVSTFSQTTFLFAEITELRLSFCITFMFLGVIYWQIPWILCNRGQRVENQKAKILKALLEIQENNNEDSFEGLQLKLKLAKSNSISPYSAFTLNHPTYGAMWTMVLTYVIVLMQFQASEKS